MLALIVWVGAAVAVAMLLMRGAMWVLARQRYCPACSASLVTVRSAEPSHTYEVLVCPTCTTAVTLAHGQRSRFAWCPACRQRSLEAPCIRLGAEEGHARVEVREHCHLCGFQHVREVGGPLGEAAPRGIVLPFHKSD